MGSRFLTALACTVAAFGVLTSAVSADAANDRFKKVLERGKLVVGVRPTTSHGDFAIHRASWSAWKSISPRT